DEHAELNAARAAVVEECVHGRADGAAGVEDVIHQDYVLIADLYTQGSFLNHRTGADGGQIVAVKRDIQRSHGDGSFFYLVDELAQSRGQRHPATAYAD